MKHKQQRTALVTGSAGFIGFHVCELLLQAGWRVVGVDCMSEYYDVSLKYDREKILLQSQNYTSFHAKLESRGLLEGIMQREKPDIIIHLAAQAGVRHSIDEPRSYLESNIVGTFELLEAARFNPPQHILMASTSSAYGANVDIPLKETLKADHQLSFYAATKKSTENIAHSYSHLYGLPVTMVRFFTVYGPWGRPDMALFKFTKSILNGDAIDVYNHGKMGRDFTFVDDLATAITLLIEQVPTLPTEDHQQLIDGDSLSSSAPFRVVNIGNSKIIALNEYIENLEKELGIKAKKNFMPMQAGDVQFTLADTRLLETLTGFKPATSVKVGIQKFVDWYTSYYDS